MTIFIRIKHIYAPILISLFWKICHQAESSSSAADSGSSAAAAVADSSNRESSITEERETEDTSVSSAEQVGQQTLVPSHTLTHHHFLFILLLGMIGKYLMIMRLVDFWLKLVTQALVWKHNDCVVHVYPALLFSSICSQCVCNDLQSLSSGLDWIIIRGCSDIKRGSIRFNSSKSTSAALTEPEPVPEIPHVHGIPRCPAPAAGHQSHGLGRPHSSPHTCACCAHFSQNLFGPRV